MAKSRRKLIPVRMPVWLVEEIRAVARERKISFPVLAGKVYISIMKGSDKELIALMESSRKIEDKEILNLKSLSPEKLKELLRRVLPDMSPPL